jgi:hypothetical protein
VTWQRRCARPPSQLTDHMPPRSDFNCSAVHGPLASLITLSR